jgi:hypothetical protein
MTTLEVKKDYYWEDGKIILTSSFHIRRGSCCGNTCRHCPYYPKYTRGNTDINK